MALSKSEKLFELVESMYKKHNKELLYHGWHHIVFVRKKALEFAEALLADTMIAEASALTHDINYIVMPDSKPEDGKPLRKEILIESGFSFEEISRIENVIVESHMGSRSGSISLEGMALSDADTLFKSLPVVPILFTQKYLAQNRTDISKLADKITSEQNPLMDQDIYFYTDYAKEKYLKWAKGNLQMWNNVAESLRDEDVKEMLGIADGAGVF